MAVLCIGYVYTWVCVYIDIYIYNDIYLFVFLICIYVYICTYTCIYTCAYMYKQPRHPQERKEAAERDRSPAARSELPWLRREGQSLGFRV